MGHILEALRLYGRNPRLWKYTWGPLLVSAFAFLAIVVSVFLFGAPFIASQLEKLGMRGDVSGWLGTLVTVVVLLLLSGVIFLAVATTLSSLMLDRLGVEVEQLLTGTCPNLDPRPSVVIADSIHRMVFTVVLALGGLCCNAVLPVVGAVIFAGFAGLLDYSASAFVRRGMLLGAQRKRIFKLKEWPTFLLLSGFVTLIPLVNLFMLPVLVVAGTIMVVRSEVSEISSTTV